MGIFEAARVVAEGEVAEASQVSPYVFGGFALLVLVVLVVVTTLLNVDR